MYREHSNWNYGLGPGWEGSHIGVYVKMAEFAIILQETLYIFNKEVVLLDLLFRKTIFDTV